MADKTFFITTPIYYINGKPHIGHAYTQIASDARARFERLRGRQVYFLTGTDENAVKVARVARELGRDPQEYVDELAQFFRDEWRALNISFDDFVRTTEPRHRIAAQRIVEKLWQGGHLEVGTYNGWYSVPDETFFRPEETVERDGKQYIAEPTEDQTKDPLEWVEESTHYFKLSGFGDALLAYYDAHADTLRPRTRRNETLAYVRAGLRDSSISREDEWGIPVPDSVPAHEGHVIYVWFEALMNYATAPGYLSDDPERQALFESVWPPDLQMMSKDIFTRFHTTLWPAMLRALDLPLPKELFAHGFWTVDGRKMSKRDPATIVAPVPFCHRLAACAGCDFGTAVDALRYYCLREVTFGSDGDFSRVGCANRYNSDLANGLGNLVNRALSMLHQYFDGVVPEAGGDLGLRAAAAEALSRVEEGYATLDYADALSEVWEVVALSNRVIEEQKPWAKIKAGDTESVAVLLRELLAVCQWCAVVLAPVMPHVTDRLRRLLALDAPLAWSQATDAALLPPGHRCLPPEPLFPRIQQIKEELLMEVTTEVPAERPQADAAVAPPSPLPPLPAETPSAAQTIDYADFAKVQLRAGRVLEAERVPKADKLLRLQVDLGAERRQIVAGIAQQFEPEALIGRTIVVVANLAPRKLRGFESQGMLLAASVTADGPPLGLLTISEDVPPGSIIK